MKAKVKKKLRSYLNGQSLTQTLSVPSEVAGIIWDYIGVSVYPCAPCYVIGPYLPGFAGQR